MAKADTFTKSGRPISKEDAHKAAQNYAVGVEHKSDPFAYSRVMSHFASGIAGKGSDGRLDYGENWGL